MTGHGCVPKSRRELYSNSFSYSTFGTGIIYDISE